MHQSHILGLSATDRREAQAHVKPRCPTRQRQLPPLCLSSKRAENHIDRQLMDDRSDQGGTTATS